MLDVETVRKELKRVFGKESIPIERWVFEKTWERPDLLASLKQRGGLADDSFVEYHADSLAALTPVGLRALIPRYMEYALLHPTSEVTERLIFHLSPSNPQSAYWRERLEAFSREQRHVVAIFLSHMANELRGQYYEHHIENALQVWET